jgi:hypothetical protein
VQQLVEATVEVSNVRLEVIFKKVKKRGFKGSKVTLEELPSHLSEQKKAEKLEDIFLKKFVDPKDFIKFEEKTLAEDFTIVKNDTNRSGKTKQIVKLKPKSPERDPGISEDTMTLARLIGVDTLKNDELLRI